MRRTQIPLPQYGPSSEAVAARVLDADGEVIAEVIEPLRPPHVETFRDAVILATLEADLGATVLAGVWFDQRWGGDAFGFT